MSDVKVTASEDKVTVESPYNPEFPSKARALGGKWSGSKRVWTFDVRDEERVRALCKAIYGYDGNENGEDVDLVTVRYTVTVDDKNPLWIGGRKVASRIGRDSRVSLGEGVIIIEGEFANSAGSRRYPELIDRYDAERGVEVTLEVRDAPRSVAENDSLPGELTIVEEKLAASLTVTLEGDRLAHFREIKAKLGPALSDEEIVGAALSYYAMHVKVDG